MGCRGPSGYVGLVNLGATCYANSVFQQLFMQPTIRQLILGGPEDSADAARAPSVFGQLQVSPALCSEGAPAPFFTFLHFRMPKDCTFVTFAFSTLT